MAPKRNWSKIGRYILIEYYIIIICQLNKFSCRN